MGEDELCGELFEKFIGKGLITLLVISTLVVGVGSQNTTNVTYSFLSCGAHTSDDEWLWCMEYSGFIIITLVIVCMCGANCANRTVQGTTSRGDSVTLLIPKTEAEERHSCNAFKDLTKFWGFSIFAYAVIVLVLFKLL